MAGKSKGRTQHPSAPSVREEKGKPYRLAQEGHLPKDTKDSKATGGGGSSCSIIRTPIYERLMCHRTRGRKKRRSHQKALEAFSLKPVAEVGERLRHEEKKRSTTPPEESTTQLRGRIWERESGVLRGGSVGEMPEKKRGAPEKGEGGFYLYEFRSATLIFQGRRRLCYNSAMI